MLLDIVKWMFKRTHTFFLLQNGNLRADDGDNINQLFLFKFVTQP